MNEMEIVLSENDILRIVNGEYVKVCLNSGESVIIRQSYLSDVAKPLINYDKQIVSNLSIMRVNRAKI